MIHLSIPLRLLDRIFTMRLEELRAAAIRRERRLFSRRDARRTWAGPSFHLTGVNRPTSSSASGARIVMAVREEIERAVDQKYIVPFLPFDHFIK